MSEFKFACPVCGQHMAADSTVSGVHVECPTCFQKVIVPRPPSANSKYILSATQYIKPQAAPPARPAGTRFTPKKRLGPVVIPLIAIVCLAGVVFYVLHKKYSSSSESPSVVGAAARPKEWSLNLTNKVFPETIAAGRIAGKEFSCQRAVLQGGTLTLRQGSSGSPDPRVTIYLFAAQAEDLRGQSLSVTTNNTGSPRVVLRWDEGQQGMTKTFTSGYALRVDFGTPTAAGMPGRIYLCVPDESWSYVAGTFNAEIRRAEPSKSPQSKPAASH